MSEIRVNKVINAAGTGSVELTQGATLPSGKTLSGAGDLNLTGIVTAASGSFTGNISVGGTITYDDVTNIDSVGIVTAGKGFRATTGGLIVTSGISTLAGTTATNMSVSGITTLTGGTIVAGITTIDASGVNVTGITTVTNFDAKGTLVEAFSSTTTAYNTDSNLNISNGNVQFSSANLGGTGTTLNIISTTGINTDLSTGQTLTVTGITAVNATTAFVNKITVDGVAAGITTHWVGGSAPTAGGGSGVDLYTFNLLKTGSATYIIVANQTKTS